MTPEHKPIYPYGNCLYIEDEIPAVIDLGAGRTFLDLPLDKIQIGLISHFHFDHLHGDGYFPNIKLYASREESQTYTNEAEYYAFHGYDLWNQIMPGIKREAYGKVVPLESDVLVAPGFREIPLAGTFQDRQIISCGYRQIMAIHLPGHTSGHYGFYLEKEGILFSGDIDLVASGPWYSSNSADVNDLITSVNRIKEIDPKILVPSHRRVQKENLQTQLDRYIQVVLDREDRIVALLKEPQTLADLAGNGLVFPGTRNLYEEFWERMTIRNHLQHLINLGLVREIDNGLYRKV